MNKTGEQFVQNFRVVAEKDGETKFFGENTRWYAIDLAHRVETQGFTCTDIQQWDKEKKEYVHDVSDRREKGDGTIIESRDSMEVLRERYGAKKVATVDLETSDQLGRVAAMSKTMATQSRRTGVDAQLLHNFLNETFLAARRLGVSSQDIVQHVTDAYPDLASQPRQRRQEANA